MNQDLTSMGRSELLDEVARLRADLADAERTCQSIDFEYEAMLANLTATQTRCTELLEEVRALRADQVVTVPPPVRPATVYGTVPGLPRSANTEHVWGYAHSEDGEFHEAGVTREAAVLTGKDESGGADFWIAVGRRPDPSEYLDVDGMVERAADAAYDEAGDVAESWPTPTKEALQELRGIVGDWARRHIPCRFWIVTGMPELVAAHEAEEI